MSGPEWMDEVKKTGEGHPEGEARTPEALALNSVELDSLERDGVERDDREGDAADLTPTEQVTLEHALRGALRPVALPAGFADRVVASRFPMAVPAGAAGRAKVLPFRRWRAVASGAVAACLLAGFFGAEEVHQRRERVHAAAANQQFETATRITNQALEHTREQLRRAGVEPLQ